MMACDTTLPKYYEGKYTTQLYCIQFLFKQFQGELLTCPAEFFGLSLKMLPDFVCSLYLLYIGLIAQVKVKVPSAQQRECPHTRKQSI